MFDWLREMRNWTSIATPSRAASRRRGHAHTMRPRLETLEDRWLPAVSLLNIPTWTEQGPGPILDGQTDGLPGNPVTGAVGAIAAQPGNSNVIFVGAVDGGIWKTSTGNSAAPGWQPLTDQFSSLAISAITFARFDATNQTVFAGTGDRSSGSVPGGAAIGLFRSRNLGASWDVVGQTAFGGNTVTSVETGLQTVHGVFPESVVLVATVGGVFRSLDAGDNWGPAMGSGLPAGQPVSDLVADEDGIIIHGTDRNDRIRIGRQVGPDGPQVVVRVNRQTQLYNYSNGETIFVYAGRGNDDVIMEDSAGLKWKAAFFGEEGNDRLVGSLLDDHLNGGSGNDYLQGGPGNDVLRGGAGNDILRGNQGDDILIGGAGHDVLAGGLGADDIRAADRSMDLIFADIQDLLDQIDPEDYVVWPRRQNRRSSFGSIFRRP